MNRRVLVLCWCVLLTACVAPRDRITLLDVTEEGGMLTVATAQGTTVLNAPLETAQVQASGTTRVGTTTPDVIERQAGPTLATVPAPPRLYRISFRTNAATLPLDADPVLEAILDDVAQHLHVEVEITGHTDTTGTPASNDVLSEARAVAIREALIARDLAAVFVRVVGRGAREPLVPTPGGVDEPRNRRVDVLVR